MQDGNILQWGVAIDCRVGGPWHGETTTTYHVVSAHNEVEANMVAEGLRDFMHKHEPGEFYVARVQLIQR